MMPPMPARVLLALQRVLLVALLAPVALIAATAAVPALVLLPFLPGGTDRAVKLITAYAAYARTLLNSSRDPCTRLQPGNGTRLASPVNRTVLVLRHDVPFHGREPHARPAAGGHEGSQR
jgi:hypothetical protein